MYILKVGIIKKLVRSIFFFFDDVIYNAIPKIYNLLISIARTSPLSQASIADMAGRIYKLLAVFMMFKVIFSLIMYVVNPDDFSDKSKGMSKLVTNIVISLALLVLTPYFFSYGYQLQTIILEDNSLAVVIFGDEVSKNTNALNTAGDQMAYLTLSPFITPNLSYFACTKVYKDVVNSDDTTSIVLNDECFGFTDLNKYVDDEATCTATQEVFTPLCKAVNNDKTSYLNKSDVENYAASVQNNNYHFLLRDDIISAIYSSEDGEVFAFDYLAPLTTIVGVMVLLFLVVTCMDIALRSIKLAFLQLIAPIPILSYVDPKGGKDGMFKKWYQLCFKTYLSLFLKIVALYFAIYIISRLGRLVDIIDGSYITNGFVKIFIVIGALMFAKNFTKILESLGVKLDGGFTLNPFKKMENEALGGKKISGAIKGAATLPAKQLIAGIDAKKHDKGFWNGVKSVPVSSKWAKKWDELTPYRAEAKKEAKKAEANLKQMKVQEEKGAEVYKAAKGDSNNIRFKNDKYKQSFDEMNREKGAMYKAQAKGEADKERVKEQLKEQLKEADRAIAEVNSDKQKGRISEIEAKQRIASIEAAKADAQEKAQNEIKDINKAVGTAEKRYNIANKKHDEMKHIYTEDAALEDAFDYYDKYATQEQKDALLGKTTAPEQNNQETQQQEPQTQSEQQNSTSNDDSDIPTADASFDELRESASNNVEGISDIIGTEPAVGFNSTEERKKQIEEQISKLVTEFDSLGNSEADNIRKEEIRKIIAELEKEL